MRAHFCAPWKHSLTKGEKYAVLPPFTSESFSPLEEGGVTAATTDKRRRHVRARDTKLVIAG